MQNTIRWAIPLVTVTILIQLQPLLMLLSVFKKGNLESEPFLFRGGLHALFVFHENAYGALMVLQYGKLNIFKTMKHPQIASAKSTVRDAVRPVNVPADFQRNRRQTYWKVLYFCDETFEPLQSRATVPIVSSHLVMSQTNSLNEMHPFPSISISPISSCKKGLFNESFCYLRFGSFSYHCWQSVLF